MRPYEPDRLLVSVHIPKCAGTSLAAWLRTAFHGRLHLHYPDAEPPERTPGGAGWCVHGHFYHHAWPIGVRDVYPEARQFITVLRDPLEMMVSSYFFQVAMGDRPADTLTAWLEDVLTWPCLFPYLGLPVDLRDPDLVDRLAEDLVWIGTVERLGSGLPVLARRLGVACPPLPRSNAALRSERLADPERWRERMRDRFPAEHRLYDFAVTTAEQEAAQMAGES
ncbi:hypothetical protein [Amorphus sp. 3PC139-8]|uniref:hypothetical protein n=1 Tax=Amorphus sp. 3PC139-8 TaxID=2735676 RepID=UPI00345D7FEF